MHSATVLLCIAALVASASAGGLGLGATVLTAPVSINSQSTLINHPPPTLGWGAPVALGWGAPAFTFVPALHVAAPVAVAAPIAAPGLALAGGLGWGK